MPLMFTSFVATCFEANTGRVSEGALLLASDVAVAAVITSATSRRAKCRVSGECMQEKRVSSKTTSPNFHSLRTEIRIRLTHPRLAPVGIHSNITGYFPYDRDDMKAHGNLIKARPQLIEQTIVCNKRVAWVGR